MEKTETKVENAKPASSANEAKEIVVRASDASISMKHSMAICNFIKGRKINYSIKFLEDVIALKKAVPMKGEIPHRKNIGAGRYPVKAAGFFIKLLKNLKTNAATRNLDVDKLMIHAKADRAPRPRKPGKYHRKFKRTHLEITGKLK
ncbi:MAG: 50S ribosomal protein L22 [Nanoarchaeota archaeon]|nr:50S ribosomal protein L22 [Nanoarchaeota archaeon]